MKKFLTVALAALMIVQSFAVFAASYGNVGTDLTLYVKTPNAEYAAETTIKAGDQVDFKATVGMADVRQQFLDAIADGDAFIDGYYSDNAEKAETAKINMRNTAFSSGNFQCTLTYPTAISLPDSIVKGKGLSGFNKEAKLGFEEVKRVNTVNGVTSTLIITLKVKESVTIGDFERSIEEYLGDMSFEGKGIAISKIGNYTITGKMEGEVAAVFAFEDGMDEINREITFTGKENAVATINVNAKTYSFAGKVTGIKEDDEVTAKLVRGATEIEVVINEDGTFENSAVNSGIYNFVVTNGTKNVTVVVNINDNVNIDIAIPDENISTVVEIIITDASAATDVVVGHEEISKETVVADAIVVAGADGSVEVKILISDVIDEVITAINEKAEEIIVDFDNEKSKVDPLAASKTEVIVKDNTGEEVGKWSLNELDKGNVMYFAMSFPTSGKKDFRVIKLINDGEKNDIVGLKEDATNSGIPETFCVDEENDMIHIYSGDVTADFVVTYTEIITETLDDDDVPVRAPDGIPVYDDILPFVDVAKTDWFYNSVKYVYENGLFKGVTETTFEPDTAITRGMFVTVLGRMSGIRDDEVVSSDYTDVATNEYYASHVKWATENGIVNGYGDGTFGPDDLITREQMATILLRYNNFLGKGPAGAWAVKIPFNDVDEISGYAVEGVMYCYKNSIMMGKNNKMFDPQGDATRAEAAAVLERLAK